MKLLKDELYRRASEQSSNYRNDALSQEASSRIFFEVQHPVGLEVEVKVGDPIFLEMDTK